MALRHAVEDGSIVVVPDDVATADTWWTVSASGAVRSILNPGIGAGKVTGSPRSVPPVNPPSKLPPKPPPPQPPKPPRVPKDIFEPAKEFPSCVPRDNENTCPAERTIPVVKIVGLSVAGLIFTILLLIKLFG
jgi:hypothetical protein